MCHVTTKETFAHEKNKNFWLWHDNCGTVNIIIHLAGCDLRSHRTLALGHLQGGIDVHKSLKN
jgi:hypothetical protein